MKVSADTDNRRLFSARWILLTIGIGLMSWGFLGLPRDYSISMFNLWALYGLTVPASLFCSILAILLTHSTPSLRFLACATVSSTLLNGTLLITFSLGWANPESVNESMGWFWLVERIFTGIALLQFAWQHHQPTSATTPPFQPIIIWSILTLCAAVVLLATTPVYPNLNSTNLHRPWEFLPGAFYFAAFIQLFSRYSAQISRFGTCVLLFLLINLCIQVGFSPFADDMMNSFFRDSSILRLAAFVIMFVGLCLKAADLIQTSQNQMASPQQMAIAPPSVSVELTEPAPESQQIVSRKVLLSLMEDFHRAREQEADAKQFAESIIENMPLMVFVKEAKELRFQRLNRAGEKLLGVSREEIIGKNDYDIFSAEQADFFIKTDYNALAGDSIIDIPEEPINTENGVRWLHTRKIPVKNAKGAPLFLLGISEDITEKRELEQRFTLLFDVAPNGLMLVRQDNIIELVNNACSDIFGYNRDELECQHLEKLLPPNIKHSHSHQIHQFWSDPRSRKMTTNPNLVGIHKDGHKIPLDIALQPFPWQGELYVLAAITDITERQRFIQELEQTNRYKTLFLANMSHELRTPMNSIIGFTEKVLKSAGTALNERNIDALTTVQRNAHHLLALINEILDLSQIEAGKMGVEREDVDLRQQLELVRTEYAQMAKSKNLHFTMQLPEQDLHITSDRRKILQICHNLVSNAVKYTEQGSVSLKVSVESHPEMDQCIRMQFIDTGIGISSDDQKKLFTAFGRSSEARQKNIQGTGLGLLITSQLVGLLGGRISVESEHGSGSTFTVLLPFNIPHG